MTPLRCLFVLCLLVLIDGCHGSGSGSGSFVPQNDTTKAALSVLPANSVAPAGTASFSVSVPADSAPQMQSLTVTLAQRDGVSSPISLKPVTLDLGPKATGCTRQPDGSLSCTAAVAAPAGSDTFTIVTYALPNGAGAVISTTQATALITAGGKARCSQTASGLAPAKAMAP